MKPPTIGPMTGPGGWQEEIRRPDECGQRYVPIRGARQYTAMAVALSSCANKSLRLPPPTASGVLPDKPAACKC
jgi:hypothetical protein